MDDLVKDYPSIRTAKKARRKIKEHTEALARVENSLARKGGDEVKGDNRKRLELSAKHHKESIADLEKLAKHYAKKGGKGTRRKPHSGKKWISSATRKLSSMSAFVTRRGKKFMI